MTTRVLATLGTPAAFTANTIQFPGIAIPAPGTVRDALAPPQGLVEGPQSSRRRWSVLVPCVAPPMRSIDTMDSGSEAVTVIAPPGPAHTPPLNSNLLHPALAKLMKVKRSNRP